MDGRRRHRPRRPRRAGPDAGDHRLGSRGRLRVHGRPPRAARGDHRAGEGARRPGAGAGARRRHAARAAVLPGDLQWPAGVERLGARPGGSAAGGLTGPGAPREGLSRPRRYGS
ncbi:hypothetical protein SCOCK_400066 [Actinacidiphila cocklensis]|uniref:Uncharacterized protein n=1 Tax=Actinacidiphila cocklensis TaxID=887465 RepID=A0A9W4DYX6_9ACTN|nr:hypothetical protein SCOCK_400066 [Actinacidiphila cocklensis]